MHELSLARAVVDILEEEARRHGVHRVERVLLRVGALRAVVPELLRTGMTFAARGTVAEDARVQIEEIPGRARCPACGSTFPVEELYFLCPACGRMGGEVLAGQELQVVEFEGD